MRTIDADELKEAIEPYRYAIYGFEGVLSLIDNAPTVEYTFEEAFQKTVCERRLYCPKQSQSEWHNLKENANDLPTKTAWYVCKVKSSHDLRLVFGYEDVTMDKFDAWFEVRENYE